MQRLGDGEATKKALKQGAITQDEVDEAIGAWRAWMASPSACAGIMHGELLIRPE